MDGKLIFVVKVKKDSDLHIYKGYGRIRVGSTNKLMTVEELVKKGHELWIVKFDSQVCKDATLEDIDWDFVRDFLCRGMKDTPRRRLLAVIPTYWKL